ncbi:hypothetical protein [uncultured Draconibacterium sp.]|uniref:hypothetical protein n=1 Tax=uncultured Draconibacterium sp. TaxID=1573823 RepID=UPI0025FAF1D7|nr:hypothetical protein [uncultured Draconibacterium sp.]
MNLFNHNYTRAIAFKKLNRKKREKHENKIVKQFLTRHRRVHISRILCLSW